MLFCSQGFTVVITAGVMLLLSLGSVKLPVTLAVLLIVPATVGVTTIVTVTGDPVATVPKLQVTVPPNVQVPWVDVADTGVTPAGSGSNTVVPVAGYVLLFVTVNVYVSGFPTVTGFGEATFVIARSADTSVIPISATPVAAPTPLMTTV